MTKVGGGTFRERKDCCRERMVGHNRILFASVGGRAESHGLLVPTMPHVIRRGEVIRKLPPGASRLNYRQGEVYHRGIGFSADFLNLKLHTVSPLLVPCIPCSVGVLCPGRTYSIPIYYLLCRIYLPTYRICQVTYPYAEGGANKPPIFLVTSPPRLFSETYLQPCPSPSPFTPPPPPPTPVAMPPS